MQSRDVLRLVFNPSGSYIQVCPGSGLEPSSAVPAVPLASIGGMTTLLWIAIRDPLRLHHSKAAGRLQHWSHIAQSCSQCHVPVAR